MRSLMPVLAAALAIVAALPAAAPAAEDREHPRCLARDLSVLVGRTEAGAGQRDATLVLRNGSPRTCRTFGYVGLRLRDGRGRALPTRVVRTDRAARRTVVLEPGDAAYLSLGWSAVAGPGEPARGRCEATPHLVDVTPPDETRRLVTGWHDGPVCQRGRIEATPLRDER